MATPRYLSSFNSENFIYLAWACVKLRLVGDTHHGGPGARQWRHVRIAFHSATIPLMSSQITCSQASTTSVGVAFITRRFILNIKVIQTKFNCIVDSISMRDMVPTLSFKLITVNLVKLFTRILVCAYSIIHRIRQTILSPVYDI